MRCHWDSFIRLLPSSIREPVDKLGKNDLTELRLRIGLPAEMIFLKGSLCLDHVTNKEDIDFCINVASQYSPWVAATMKLGFLTTSGGHRIGVCGTLVGSEAGKYSGVDQITSLCLRVARDIPDMSEDLYMINSSILIIGPPGCGKTTLLRDLIRKISDNGHGSIGVVDERLELFPGIHTGRSFPTGKRTDIVRGSTKADGVELLIRCMGPDVIAVDEITAPLDCQALLHAAWCGVRILATAHASSADDLWKRDIYRPLMESRIFDQLVTLQKDKSWRREHLQYDN